MLTYQVLDHGYVKLVECWGSEQGIIEAARMSTQKGFEGWGPYCPNANVGDTEHVLEDVVINSMGSDYEGIACRKCGHAVRPKAGDEKLLSYLYKNKHMTPFEMAGIIIEVQAPIFVFREWHRHRTQSYNEMSSRYAPLPELCYIPSAERLARGGQSSTNKQGSGEVLDAHDVHMAREEIRLASENAFTRYRQLLARGVARELARLVLPVNTYSRMRASANLRNWLALLTLRQDVATQWEFRQYADVVFGIVQKEFPRVSQLFAEERIANATRSK